MPNYELVIRTYTRDGGGINGPNGQLTESQWEELLRALNEAEAAHGSGTREWMASIDRNREPWCIREEYQRCRQQRHFARDAQPQSPTTARTTEILSGNQAAQSEAEVRQVVNSNLWNWLTSFLPNNNNHQGCEHCGALTARVSELERRLALLEQQQSGEYLAQITQAPPPYNG